MPRTFGRLTEAFLNSPVVDMNGYKYFINPVSDGIPRTDSELLEEIVEGMVERSDRDYDIILAPEAMGIPLAVGISLRTGIPYSVIRKRRYGLKGEIALDQSTGYSKSPMYINGVKPGDRVAIVDDVVSTGGTLRAVVDALGSEGVTVSEISVVFNKSEDIDSISRELGVPIRYLISVGVTDEGVPFIRDAL